MSAQFNFQYCPKIVIFNDQNQVLLCKRQGELDFDGVFSFPGGKREITDTSIEAGITRELQEEIGSEVRLSIYRLFAIEKEYQKKAGNIMILPHYFARYQGGQVILNPLEYSEYRWFDIASLSTAPVIETVVPVCQLFDQFQTSEFCKSTWDVHSFSV